jgi:hypothetical protein
MLEGSTDSLETLHFETDLARRCTCCPEQVQHEEIEDVVDELGS